jgi:AbiV family abortive infection protein
MTGQELRHGVWYAVEQAGNLLGSATLLFSNGQSAAAVGVAMLAAEELGRHRILRDLAKRADSGDQIHPDEVRERCEDHATKQQHGLGGISFHQDRDTQLGKLMMTKLTSPVGSKEWHDASDQLDVVTEAKQKRLPHERHSLRMSAFYVDLQDSGVWSRPNAINRETARRQISDVVNDYAVLRGNLQIESAEEDSAEMLQALKTMTPQPSLPLPRWPVYPVEAASNSPLPNNGATLPDAKPRKVFPFAVIVMVAILAISILAWLYLRR